MTDFTILNPGIGGDAMDETGITYTDAPTLRKRPNVVISGLGQTDFVTTPSTPPFGDEVGLINRPIHSPYPGTPVATLSSVTLVPANTETTIASFLVPSDVTFYFLSFVSSGDVDGLYRLYIFDPVSTNLTAMLSARSSVAIPTAQVGFPYSVFTATTGQTVFLKVTHFATSIQGNFEGTIVGYTL
jgi:hypothetical protein